MASPRASSSPPAAHRFALKRMVPRILFAAGIVFLAAPIMFFAVFRFVPVTVTSFMVSGAIDGLFANPRYTIQHDWVPLDDIAPSLQRAVIASEDQKFLRHHGLDFDAIRKAYSHNSRGNTVRGASTISQQTVKNLFLWQGRSYVRKAIEAWLTLLMELMWPKERILEVYLNSAEFGRGIYGAQAAAQAYFKRDASDLRKRDAALLAAALPSPRLSNPAKPSDYLQSQARRIETQMARIGAVEAAFAEGRD